MLHYASSYLTLPHLTLPHHRLLRHDQPDAGVCGVAVDARILFRFRIPLNPVRGSLSVADGIPGRALFCFRIPLNPVRGSLSVAEGIPSRTHNPVWGCMFLKKSSSFITIPPPLFPYFWLHHTEKAHTIFVL